MIAESHNAEAATVPQRRSDIESSTSTFEEQHLNTPLLVHNSNSNELPQQHGMRHRQNHSHPPYNVDERPETRLLARGGAFGQSRGKWRVERLSRGTGSTEYRCGSLGRVWHEWILGDWFHRLAYQRTCALMVILFVIYTAIVIFFAFVYRSVSIMGKETIVNPDGSKTVVDFCDLDIHSKIDAMYFSLSTMTTIGYGASDYYFGGCWTPLVLVLWQVCSAITFDAVAVGLLFHRMARGRKRGQTILFSDKAIIKRVKGVSYLMFRIGELRRYSLIEATVRCYCIRHERLPIEESDEIRNTTGTSSNAEVRHVNDHQDEQTQTIPTTHIETTHFQSRQLKFLHPDESYEPRIWMGLPQIVVHRMDHTSPLMPPSPWYDGNGVAHSWHDEALPTPTQESSFHDASTGSAVAVHRTGSPDMESIQQFLIDRDMELVILVEGTDEGTGAATQARHSYKLSNLSWNRSFVPCVQPYVAEQHHRTSDPAVTIDFARFHDTRPSPPTAQRCAHVPNV